MEQTYEDRNGYLRYTATNQLVHREVAAQKIGRPLRHEEVVHHIDQKKKNNHPSNLYICKDQNEHERIHHRHYGVNNTPAYVQMTIFLVINLVVIGGVSLVLPFLICPLFLLTVIGWVLLLWKWNEIGILIHTGEFRDKWF